MTVMFKKLPQLSGVTCLTDGGMETDLLFNHGFDLPEFASYDLLRTEKGERFLHRYFDVYVSIAARHGFGLVLETPTWRANREWGARIGDSPQALGVFNRRAVALLQSVRTELADAGVPIVVSGCIGPRGDGYRSGDMMCADAAATYHRTQVETLTDAGADMVAALTMTYASEATGIVRVAAETGIPVCISFTVETDGRLPSGQSPADAITEVDSATDGAAAYFMINCAHPTHVDHIFSEGGNWLERVKGFRGNASCLSHAELDEAETLDDGDPEAFGAQVAQMRSLSPHLTVLGGCCGTDHRHIDALARNLSGVSDSDRLHVG